MTDEVLRKEVAGRLYEAFLRCTANGQRWISRSQAHHEAVTVAVEMVLEERKRYDVLVSELMDGLECEDNEDRRTAFEAGQEFYEPPQEPTDEQG